ncbi:MAG: hypothetical protein ACKESB_03180 [Candidatus Hodgkinia cicadicola]
MFTFLPSDGSAKLALGREGKRGKGGGCDSIASLTRLDSSHRDERIVLLTKSRKTESAAP